MSNQQRDTAGKYASSPSISSGTDAAPRGPASSTTSATDPALRTTDLAGRSSASMPDASAADYPDARTTLMKGAAPGKSGGGHTGGAPGHSFVTRDYDMWGPGGGMGAGEPLDLGQNNFGPDDQALRAAGYGSGESGSSVQTQEGPSQHGRDIPPGGVPGPADPAPAGGRPTGGMPGGGLGGRAATAGAELADLAPFAAL